HAGPCPPEADLTAFAHGEFSPRLRAEVSRHLLRCPACHARAEAARDVLLRLAALSASGDAWRADLAAADAALHLGRRRSGLAVGLGVAAAALLAVGLWTLRAPPPSPPPPVANAVPAGRSATARARAVAPAAAPVGA